MIAALRALSDPTRLRIVQMLSTSCCGTAAIGEGGEVEGPTAGEVCCRITGADKITSTVSHHLQELEGAGLITRTRRGKATICRLRPETLEALSAQLHTLAQGDIHDDCC